MKPSVCFVYTHSRVWCAGKKKNSLHSLQIKYKCIVLHDEIRTIQPRVHSPTHVVMNLLPLDANLQLPKKQHVLTYLRVEKRSLYLSFLFSVWNPEMGVGKEIPSPHGKGWPGGVRALHSQSRGKKSTKRPSRDRKAVVTSRQTKFFSNLIFMPSLII